MKHKNLLKSILSLMLITLTTVISIFITSCAGEEDKNDGIINNGGETTCLVSVKYGEGGTATTSDTQVMSGWEVTLTATPEETYRFVNWTLGGEEVSRENPYKAVITKSAQYQANFEKDNYTLKVTAGEGGTVKATKEGELLNETEVTLTATPNEGYSFINWTINGEEVSTEKTYTITITKDIEIKANFITHKVTVVASEGGTAKASKTQAGHNEQVTLTATPNEDYGFVNWTVNGEEVSTKAKYTVTVTSDIEYKANFATLKEIYKPTGTENGKDLVDLGLPSGIKWATCNVGATTPEEYGDYFAWGETEPKDYYYWNTYKYCNGSSSTMTKYCVESYYGTVDNKTTLELSDDAARVNWGGKWRMPTKAEQDELRNTSNCTWTWTIQNGVNGYKVTSKRNGNSIFLPAAGYRGSGNLYGAGSDGNYWSSSLSTSTSCYAYDLFFSSDYVGWYYSSRYVGQSVRAVCE